MNITILGCGYAGSAIAQKLRHSSNLITVTTTTLERVPDLEAIADRVVVVKGDDEAGLRSLLHDQDRLIVSVAPSGEQQVGADGYRDTYLNTAKTLASVLKETASIKQVIYTSSCAVYGDRHGEWVDEDSIVKPNTPNGEILDKTEQVLLAAASEALICILRLGAIYGSGQEIVDRFSEFAGTTRPGSGNHFTNWIHLDDIVGIIEFALTHQLSGIFNVVNSTPVTSRELFDQMCNQYHLPPIEWDASLPRTRKNDRQVSNQKIRAAGYSLIHPKISL